MGWRWIMSVGGQGRNRADTLERKRAAGLVSLREPSQSLQRNSLVVKTVQSAVGAGEADEIVSVRRERKDDRAVDLVRLTAHRQLMRRNFGIEVVVVRMISVQKRIRRLVVVWLNHGRRISPALDQRSAGKFPRRVRRRPRQMRRADAPRDIQ